MQLEPLQEAILIIEASRRLEGAPFPFSFELLIYSANHQSFLAPNQLLFLLGGPLLRLLGAP